MSFSLSDKLQHCSSVIDKLNNPLPQLDTAYLHYATRKVEWDAIRELIFDLSYNNELGLLSTNEVELYEKLSSAFAEVLLPTDEDHPSECANLKLDSCQKLLFQSLIEDKLVEKFERLQKEEVSNRNLSKMRSQRNALIIKLVRLQCDFTETISRICTVTSELFREVRRNAQAKTNLLYSTVLLTEAEGLRSQVWSLNHSIMEEALKNKRVVTHLQQTKSHLSETITGLENELDELERILRAYQNQDDQYQELVRRYGECQRQIALRADLLNGAQSALTTNNLHNFRTQVRRSLSLDDLPKTDNTFDHSLH